MRRPNSVITRVSVRPRSAPRSSWKAFRQLGAERAEVHEQIGVMIPAADVDGDHLDADVRLDEGGGVLECRTELTGRIRDAGRGVDAADDVEGVERAAHGVAEQGAGHELV